MDKKKLSSLLSELNISINEEKLEKFEIYYNEIIEWNKKINLTAIKNEKDVIIKHFYDSLIIMQLDEWKKEGKVIDIGTGAGLPGIPLKIINPSIEITLLDSLKKRIIFLKRVKEILDISNINIIHGRAEELGHDRMYREKYDFVVSRAVARLNVLLEYCLPFVKEGAYFVAYKGPEIEEEIKEAEKALEILGGRIKGIKENELPENGGKRTLIIIEKNETCPIKYPRKAGMPEKRPI